MNQLPHLASDLVRQLDELLPPRCIQPDESPESAHRYAGSRSVVEFLLRLLDESEAKRPDEPILR